MPVILLLACAAPPATTPTLPAGTATSGDPGGSTGTAPSDDRLVPTAFAFNGAFGYDPALDATEPYLADPSDPFTFEPWFSVVFELVDPLTLVESTCTVTVFNVAGRVPPAAWWEAEPGALWWAMDLDREPDVVDTCYHWDPAWGPDATALVTSLRWSLAVGAPAEGLFDPDDPDALPAWDEATYGEGDWETHLSRYAVGAAFGLAPVDAPEDAPPTVLEDWAWAIGYEVDEAFALVVDPGTATGTTAARHAGGSYVLIPADEIEAAPTLPRGVYTIALLGTLPVEVLLDAAG